MVDTVDIWDIDRTLIHENRRYIESNVKKIRNSKNNIIYLTGRKYSLKIQAIINHIKESRIYFFTNKFLHSDTYLDHKIRYIALMIEEGKQVRFFDDDERICNSVNSIFGKKVEVNRYLYEEKKFIRLNGKEVKFYELEVLSNCFISKRKKKRDIFDKVKADIENGIINLNKIYNLEDVLVNKGLSVKYLINLIYKLTLD